MCSPAATDGTRKEQAERHEPTLLDGDCKEHLPDLEFGFVQVVIIDPPRVLGADPHAAVESDQDRWSRLPERAWTQLLRDVFSQLSRYLNPEASIYVLAGRDIVSQLLKLVRETKNLQVADQIIWARTNPTAGKKPGWTSSWNSIIYVTKSATPIWTPAPGNVVPNVISEPAVDEKVHENEKPVALLERLIEVSSRPGGVILDPFAGSGSTGEAAWKLGRKSVLIERDEKYVELIRKRISGFRVRP